MERTVRRLAAVLAADVVGYSGKIEADESSTLAAMKDVRATTIDPLLAENSGRIVKTMGDGFIAEFGSVVDAVTFAVAMHAFSVSRQCLAELGREG
jgi:class 3 adenylate cyclase